MQGANGLHVERFSLRGEHDQRLLDDAPTDRADTGLEAQAAHGGLKGDAFRPKRCRSASTSTRSVPRSMSSLRTARRTNSLGRWLERRAHECAPRRPNGTRRGTYRRSPPRSRRLSAAVEPNGRRTQNDMGGDHQQGTNDGFDHVAGTGEHPNGRREPDRGRCVDSSYVDAVVGDDSGAEEADARNHLGSNPGGSIPCLPLMSTPSNSKSAAPSATSAFVRSPAIRWCHWRSTPMTAPSASATAARPKQSRTSFAGVLMRKPFIFGPFFGESGSPVPAGSSQRLNAIQRRLARSSRW